MSHRPTIKAQRVSRNRPPPIDAPPSPSYARAGRAGERGARPRGAEPGPAEPDTTSEDVSRETFVEYDDNETETARKDLPSSADVSLCNIARRTGFMLRTLLQVWEATLPGDKTRTQRKYTDSIEAAADILVTVYAEVYTRGD